MRIITFRALGRKWLAARRLITSRNTTRIEKTKYDAGCHIDVGATTIVAGRHHLAGRAYRS